MKLCVCLKQVPDVTGPLHVQDGRLAAGQGRFVLNAYDAVALEAALRLVSAHGGEVDVVLAGPASAQETLRKALAMGADRAVHIVAEAEADSATYAGLLAAHLGEQAYDLVLCGSQAQDTDAGLAGGMLAARLDLPYATHALELAYEPETGCFVVTRTGETGTEIVELRPPGLVTCSSDMNEPRIPALKGILQARSKPIRQVEPAALPADRPRTTVVRYETLPPRPPARMLSGTPQEQVRQLLDLLPGRRNRP